KALISIGRDDLQELYDEGKSEEIVCNFCNKKYEFTHEHIGDLLNSKN
ncbi:MAG: Hsp33 family molecular chaperone HslO, partial [Clostridium sp.]|nr:Hsp33 family molecular chaperone HslO [Clostridium sp.]